MNQVSIALPFKILKDQVSNAPKVPKNLSSLIPVHTPNWGQGANSDALKATWLGHACYCVEFPVTQDASRGPRVLFDPALSHRCSPTQCMGPSRITPVPCKTDDIPAIDAIVLSHNHYDHTDTATLQSLWNKYKPQIFAPLGNRPYFKSIGVADSHIHTLDWWDSKTMSLSLPSKSGDVPVQLKLTCLPSQHISNRGVLDRGATLWGSWAVEEISSASEPKKVYFAGDTGYRTVLAGEDEDKVPVCPAFAEIGERVGPFHFAMIPIGAYAPRELFSPMHAAPSDSVRIFKDIKAKKALGMHWGTWILTTEPIMEPPKKLKEECEKLGVPDGDFDICGLGETRFF